MKVATVVHQQISQIKWRVLACLALIMALPLEEATVSLLEGDGFYVLMTIMPSVMLGPLLAGLIACANVQGDLDDKRHAFWRSKPVGVKRFIALKYVVGLALALIVQVYPIVFAIVTSIAFGDDKAEWVRNAPLNVFYLFPLLLSVMTYSLCFACNIVVRKTARSWLIGMLMACLLLLVPFVLPLGYKDVVSDVALWASGFYLAIMLIAAAGAFAFALFATHCDWRLKTNLKGLLWVSAATGFGLLFFVSSQVASIKVLAEKSLPVREFSTTFERIADNLLLSGRYYVDVHADTITFEETPPGSLLKPVHWLPPGHEMPQDWKLTVRPQWPQKCMYRLAGGEYSFALYAYYIEREELTSKGKIQKTPVFQKLSLTCLELGDEAWIPVSEVDLSACIEDPASTQEIRFKLIDHQLVVFANKSCFLIDFAQPNVPKVIERKIGVLDRAIWLSYGRGESVVPLIPLKNLGIEQRIQLSIDRTHWVPHHGNETSIIWRTDMFESSIVDMRQARISFYLVSSDKIVRHEVSRWDNRLVYCTRTTERPFTLMEDAAQSYARTWLVTNGKLYLRGQSSVLVFDVSQIQRIRKIGHFTRMNIRIEDMEVLDNGNVLLSLVQHRAGQHVVTICLLDDPGRDDMDTHESLGNERKQP